MELTQEQLGRLKKALADSAEERRQAMIKINAHTRDMRLSMEEMKKRMAMIQSAGTLTRLPDALAAPPTEEEIQGAIESIKRAGNA